MKKTYFMAIGLTIAYLTIAVLIANPQESYAGNVFSYGTGQYTGLRTANFTLTLNSITPDDQAANLLSTLQADGQDALLKAVRDQDLGSFSLNGGLARKINAVRETNVGGKRHIYAIFERWEQFAEVRGGYRSLDYPFGYIELTIDLATGKGEGKYFAAAKIRWKKGENSHVEIEDYATFPAKLVNVRSSSNPQ